MTQDETMKKSTSLGVVSLIMVVIPSVYLWMIYGWQTVAALIVMLWAQNIDHRARKLMEKGE
jgi:hypothetical protein